MDRDAFTTFTTTHNAKEEAKRYARKEARSLSAYIDIAMRERNAMHKKQERNNNTDNQ